MSTRRLNHRDSSLIGGGAAGERSARMLRGGAAAAGLVGRVRGKVLGAGGALEVNVSGGAAISRSAAGGGGETEGQTGGGLGRPATHERGAGAGGGPGAASAGIKENTYRMSPDTEHKFMAHKVEKLLRDVLDAKLHNVKYQQEECARLAREVCSMIKDKTKEFEFSRYKLVTQVLLGQDSDQSVQVASRCLWNHETDDFAAATYRNSSLYAVAIVYGMYLD